MAGNPLKKVQTGQALALPAAAYNAFVDAAAYVQARQTSRQADPSHQHHQASVIPVRNDSSQAVERFGVLAANGPIVSPDDADEFARQVTLKGITPSGTTSGRFVVTLESIPVGEVGLAVAAGVVQVQVKIRKTTHGYAIPEPGRVDRLMTHESGPARILWRENGQVGQVKWAILRIEGSEPPWLLKWGTVTEVPCHENWVEVYPDDAEADEDRVRLILHLPDLDTVPKKQILVDDRLAYWEIVPVTDHLGVGLAINPDIDGTSFGDDGTLLIHPKVHHIEWVNMHGTENRADFQFAALPAIDCEHQNTSLRAEWLGIDLTAYSQSYLGLRVLHLPQRWVRVTREPASVTATIEWLVEGDNEWISVDDMTGQLQISHGGPSAMASYQNIVSGGSFDVSSRNLTLNVMRLQWDGRGHELLPAGQNNLVLNIPHTEYVADETWISRVGSQFQHIGPATAASSVQVLTGGTFDNGTRELTLYTATVSYDAKGHEIDSETGSSIVLSIPDADTVYSGDAYIHVGTNAIQHSNADQTRPTANQWTVTGEHAGDEFPDAWVIARTMAGADVTLAFDADLAGHVKSPNLAQFVQSIAFRHNTPQTPVETITIQGIGGLTGSGTLQRDYCGHLTTGTQSISIEHGGGHYSGSIVIEDKNGVRHTLSFTNGHLSGYTTST